MQLYVWNCGSLYLKILGLNKCFLCYERTLVGLPPVISWVSILPLSYLLHTSIWLNKIDELDHSANDRSPLVKGYCPQITNKSISL